MPTPRSTAPTRTRLLTTAACALAAVAGAAQAPRLGDGPIATLALRHPDLEFSDRTARGDALPAEAPRLRALGVEPAHAWLDLRGGAWATLVASIPLLPGAGSGNDLEWRQMGLEAPATPADLERHAWRALRTLLERRGQAFGIDPADLPAAKVTLHDDGRRIQIHAPRVHRGVPVRGAYLTAVSSHGNLVLLGFRHWGTIDLDTTPTLGATEARRVLGEHLGPWRPAPGARPRLVLLPTSSETAGARYGHRLAWVFRLAFPGFDPGSWEALVDAHSGELLAFDDKNRYASVRRVGGGVYPVSNDGAAPGGLEEDGYPMPFAWVDQAGQAVVTDAGGGLAVCVEGEISTDLRGPYIGMVDFCGEISETSGGDIDLGSGPGIDCDVPDPGSSPGNTHASRTAFYELNRMAAGARAHLPANVWLGSQLEAVVNIPDFGLPEFNCNAFWDEVTINFFTSGQAAPGLVCTNTGELSGVLDHEWGHGLDDNDAVPTISNPGEGIADVYAALRLGESCIGRGFYDVGGSCGDDDPCLTCDGVREIDWALRQSGVPHDLAWIDAHCAPPILGDAGPCGGGVHCEGAVVSEAVWDLVHRDLPALHGMDLPTAERLATRLTYLGAGGVGQWYDCADGTGLGDGCNADGGYLNYLAMDDDDGDLGDGTPHMDALFAAFDRHGIACPAPPPQAAGCASAPTQAPVVVLRSLDRAAQLRWDAVADAAGYEVWRSEGALGCQAGRVKVAETAGTELVDTGLRNGLEVFYTVVPIGADPACAGPASPCGAVTPGPGPGLGLDPDSVAVTAAGGDMDGALDNCEAGDVTFDLVNVGATGLTDVTLVAVTPVSHPEVVVTTPLPVQLTPSLPVCGAVAAAFSIEAAGLAFNDTLELRVDVTAAELVPPERSFTVRVTGTETSEIELASKTFDFEADLEGWEVVEGTFARSSSGGGADGTAAYTASSADLPDQCDGIRSPLMRLSATSSLSVSTRFDIEPPLIIDGSVFWFDRANVGVLDAASGQRTPVEPDGGRPYNATGTDGTCQTTNQNGWADSMPDWAASTFSASALAAGAAPGQLVRLDLRYGTDVDVEGWGFHFDEVTLTDLSLVVPDEQSDVCGPPLVLAPPDPGVAGVQNDFAVSGATAGGKVFYFFGRIAGAADPGVAGCPGISLGFDPIKRLGRMNADAGGLATLTALVPAQAAGKTLLYQVVDRVSCSVSPLVQFTYPP